MKPAGLLLVPFREVRHDQPDDCVHYEPVAVRGRLHDWTIPAHSHPGLHQFQFLETGTVVAEIDGERLEAAAPLLVMLAPGSVHAFTYSPDAGGHQVTVPTGTLRQLAGDAVAAQAQLGSSFLVQAEFAQAACADASRLFDQLSREFRGADIGRVQCLLAHMTLVAMLFLRARGEQSSAQRSHGSRDTLLQRFRALVEVHYLAHQPLAFYGEQLGVTADHLSRTCRQLTGHSALDLVNHRLILEARRRLAYTAASVNEIAADLGYQDAAYFSKFFHRQVGHSPSRYRELVARGALAATGE